MNETKFRNIQKIIQQQAREFALITIASDGSTEEGRKRARIAPWRFRPGSATRGRRPSSPRG